MHIPNQAKNTKRIENEAKPSYIALDEQIFALNSWVDKKELIQHVANILLLEIEIIKDKEEKEDDWCPVKMDLKSSKMQTKEDRK